MIKLVLAFYLFLFPQCEMMVSWLTDFSHCNDSSAWSAHCYAMSDQGYGSVRPGGPPARLYGPEAFIIKLPFVRIVSCWR